MTKSPKIQRWIDLLAALLARRFPVTFEELIPDVPAYAAGDQTKPRPAAACSSATRTSSAPSASPSRRSPARRGRRRRLPAADPRLLPPLPRAPLRSRRHQGPRKSDKYGYQSLPTLTFEADELAAVAEAAARVRELGDPLLAEHADSAMRKLACDLPVDAAAAPSTRVVPARARAAPELFATLGDALERRKRLTFAYHTMGSDAVGERTVEPFGLFFLSQHWYLAARTSGEDDGQELPAEPRSPTRR